MTDERTAFTVLEAVSWEHPADPRRSRDLCIFDRPACSEILRRAGPPGTSASCPLIGIGDPRSVWPRPGGRVGSVGQTIRCHHRQPGPDHAHSPRWSGPGGLASCARDDGVTRRSPRGDTGDGLRLGRGNPLLENASAIPEVCCASGRAGGGSVGSHSRLDAGSHDHGQSQRLQPNRLDDRPAGSAGRDPVCARPGSFVELADPADHGDCPESFERRPFGQGPGRRPP